MHHSNFRMRNGQLFLLIVSILFSTSLLAVESRAVERPSFELRENSGPHPPEGHEYRTADTLYAMSFFESERGNVKNALIKVGHQYRLSRDERPWPSVIIKYPRLKEGDIAPMLGDLYEVSKLGDRRVTLEPADLSLLPNEATDPPWKHATIPLGGSFGSGSPRWNATIAAIYQDKQTNEWVFDCDLREIRPSKTQRGSTLHATSLKGLKAGDELVSNDPIRHFRVERIVPSDKDNGVIGWVEVKAELEKEPAG